MKTVLVLGAGRVSGPLVDYLLAAEGISVTVADADRAAAEARIAGHPRGAARCLDAMDENAVREAVAGVDLVASLLPKALHGRVARGCLAEGRSLVTASYVDAEMAGLDEEVRKAGLLFLNEMGVDPGLDHMAAVRMIAAAHGRGGAVVEFHSSCGGLPAPAHNTNPFGYKFSWSPEGMLMAAREGGRYLRDGGEVEVSPAELFQRYGLTEIPGVGVFEVHVNRDALPYRQRYGIPEAKGIFRGTLRNVGHCETFGYFRELGLLDGETPLPRPAENSNPTVREALATWLGLPVETLEDGIGARLNVPTHALILKKLKWLGLLDERRPALPAKTPLELLAARMKERLVYAPGETDLLVQQHGLTAEYPDGRRERWTAVLSEIGDPKGHGAMARTVGLPAAIGARLILEGKVGLTGVRTPVHPEIYKPVLSELETMGIRFRESVVSADEALPLVWP
ncbi:MAG: saccharopine dehydrogenase C-terminal domain-containing protein [Thermodesulfobacteriota bacterium]